MQLKHFLKINNTKSQTSDGFSYSVKIYIVAFITSIEDILTPRICHNHKVDGGGFADIWKEKQHIQLNV